MPSATPDPISRARAAIVIGIYAVCCCIEKEQSEAVRKMWIEARRQMDEALVNLRTK